MDVVNALLKGAWLDAGKALLKLGATIAVGAAQLPIQMAVAVAPSIADAAAKFAELFGNNPLAFAVQGAIRGAARQTITALSKILAATSLNHADAVRAMQTGFEQLLKVNEGSMNDMNRVISAITSENRARIEAQIHGQLDSAAASTLDLLNFALENKLLDSATAQLALESLSPYTRINFKGLSDGAVDRIHATLTDAFGKIIAAAAKADAVDKAVILKAVGLLKELNANIDTKITSQMVARTFDTLTQMVLATPTDVLLDEEVQNSLLDLTADQARLLFKGDINPNERQTRLAVIAGKTIQLNEAIAQRLGGEKLSDKSMHSLQGLIAKMFAPVIEIANILSKNGSLDDAAAVQVMLMANSTVASLDKILANPSLSAEQRSAMAVTAATELANLAQTLKDAGLDVAALLNRDYGSGNTFFQELASFDERHQSSLGEAVNGKLGLTGAPAPPPTPEKVALVRAEAGAMVPVGEAGVTGTMGLPPVARAEETDMVTRMKVWVLDPMDPSGKSRIQVEMLVTRLADNMGNPVGNRVLSRGDIIDLPPAQGGEPGAPQDPSLLKGLRSKDIQVSLREDGGLRIQALKDGALVAHDGRQYLPFAANSDITITKGVEAGGFRFGGTAEIHITDKGEVSLRGGTVPVTHLATGFTGEMQAALAGEKSRVLYDTAQEEKSFKRGMTVGSEEFEYTLTYKIDAVTRQMRLSDEPVTVEYGKNFVGLGGSTFQLRAAPDGQSLLTMDGRPLDLGPMTFKNAEGKLVTANVFIEGMSFDGALYGHYVIDRKAEAGVTQQIGGGGGAGPDYPANLVSDADIKDLHVGTKTFHELTGKVAFFGEQLVYQTVGSRLTAVGDTTGFLS